MKPSRKKFPQKRVLLWPEAKIYETAGAIRMTQRVPVCKVAIASSRAGASVYFEGEPIVLN